MVFFNEEIAKIKHYLEKLLSLGFVGKQIKFFLENKINNKRITFTATKNAARYYKLPYIDHISTHVKRKINRFCKCNCKSLSIKIVLTPFKVADMVNVKDQIPKFLKSFVVYKCICPDCNACYIRETTRDLSTRIKKHLETDKKSHIFAHLVNNETCKALSTENCFEIIDSASISFKGYLHYKMVTSQNVPSKGQIKNFFIS